MKKNVKPRKTQNTRKERQIVILKLNNGSSVEAPKNIEDAYKKYAGLEFDDIVIYL